MPRKKAMPARASSDDFSMETKSCGVKVEEDARSVAAPEVQPQPKTEVPSFPFNDSSSGLSDAPSSPEAPPQLKRKLAESISGSRRSSPVPKRHASGVSISRSSRKPGILKKPGRRPSAALKNNNSTSKYVAPESQKPNTITSPDSALSSRRNSEDASKEGTEHSSSPAPEVPSSTAPSESSGSSRRSDRRVTFEPALSSPRSSPRSSPSSQSQSSSPPQQADLTCPGKRKLSEQLTTDDAIAPKRTRTTRQSTRPGSTLTHAQWKDRTIWPDHDPKNPTDFACDGVTKFNPASGDEKPCSKSPNRSPNKPARGARGGRGGGRSRGGKGRGRGGRAGGSPDPPFRSWPFSEDEKNLMAMLKARQGELKKFFSSVGAHQIDLLDRITTRDLNRLAKKPNAHKKVPEYDEIIADLEDAKMTAVHLANKRYEIELDAEMRRLEREEYVIKQQYTVSSLMYTNPRLN
jgi:hypothetical protein